MKTLHIIDGIGPPSARGSALIYEHLKKLAERGISVDILTLIDNFTPEDAGHWFACQEKEYGIRIYYVDTPILKHWYVGYVMITRILYWFKTVRLQYRNHYDIINDFSTSPFMFYRTGLLRLFCRAKLIHTLISYGPGFFASYYFPLGIRYLHRVLCLTKHMKREIARSPSDDSRVSYFRLGVELKRFAQANDPVDIRRKYGLPEDKLIVLYLGPIERGKGVFVLSEASCKIPESARLHFVFACARFFSRNERIRKIKALRERMKSCKHTFQIIRDLVDVPSLMDISDIFVLPQLTMYGTIAPPVTLLEAMAAGKAIIASRIAGVNELIVCNENGLMFAPGYSGELARHIQTLAANPQLREKLGNRARADMRNKHNLDSAVSNLIEIYRNCMP